MKFIKPNLITLSLIVIAFISIFVSFPISVVGLPTPLSKNIGKDVTEVKYVQRKLKEYGYYIGSIDGIVGGETIRGVRNFRQDTGMDVNAPLFPINKLVQEVDLRLDLGSYSVLNKLPPDIVRIKQRGKVIVGMLKYSRFPFFYGHKIDANGLFPNGLDVELIRDIASGLEVGVEIDSSAMYSSDLINLLLDRKVDMVVSKLSITKKRVPNVMFTNPYVSMRRTLMTKRNNLPRNISYMDAMQVSQLLGNFSGRVGVLKNGAYQDYGREDFPLAIIIGFDSLDEAVKDLIKGKIDMIYWDEVSMLVLLDSFPNLTDDYVFYGVRGKSDLLGIGLPPNSLGLLSYLNSVVAMKGRALSSIPQLVHGELERTKNEKEVR